MSSRNGLTKTVTATAAVIALAYGATRLAFRVRQAIQNMKIIQSVDTGSVWTTE